MWIIRDTKNGTDHQVPLSEQVVDILLERKYSDDSHQHWIFPAQRSNKYGYTLSAHPGRKRVVELTGINGWTSHDLRRTGRTVMARLKIEPHICERVLNHSQGGIQAVYDHYGYIDEKRDALEKLANEITRIVK